MTAPLNDAPFRFETSYDTRDGRPNLNAARRSKRVTENQLFVIFGVMGVACLFWRYTIALGAVTLGLMVFLWAMRRHSQALRKKYERLQEPSEIVHMTVTESGYSLKGDDFFAEAKWSGVFNAFETDRHLFVQSWHGPRLYVRVDELRQAGLYDRVRAILDARGATPRRL
jgi:hypothetical protein